MSTRRKQIDQSRRQVIAKTKAELTILPKVPVRDVQVPLMVQVKFGGLVSLIFPLLAVICYVGTNYAINSELWRHFTFVMLSISGIIYLFLIMISCWTLSLSFRMRQLAAGNYYVLWDLPEEEWLSQYEKSIPSLSKILLLTSLVTIGAGLSAAGQAYADNKLFFGTVREHFGGTVAISLLCGLAIGLFIWKLLRLKTEFLTSCSGRALIGPCGLYRAGNFWSFDGTFQRLYDISISGEEQKQVNLKIGTSGEHAIKYEFIAIPIPKGEILKAKLLCRELKQKYSL